MKWKRSKKPAGSDKKENNNNNNGLKRDNNSALNNSNNNSSINSSSPSSPSSPPPQSIQLHRNHQNSINTNSDEQTDSDEEIDVQDGEVLDDESDSRHLSNEYDGNVVTGPGGVVANFPPINNISVSNISNMPHGLVFGINEINNALGQTINNININHSINSSVQNTPTNGLQIHPSSLQLHPQNLHHESPQTYPLSPNLSSSPTPSNPPSPFSQNRTPKSPSKGGVIMKGEGKISRCSSKSNGSKLNCPIKNAIGQKMTNGRPGAQPANLNLPIVTSLPPTSQESEHLYRPYVA